MKPTKAGLRRVGRAALCPLSDGEIERDPARALKIAQDAMRATVKAYEAATEIDRRVALIFSDWRQPYRSIDASGSPDAAGNVGRAWFDAICSVEMHTNPMSLSVEASEHATVLYRDRYPIAAFFVARDPMNFAQLFRWRAPHRACRALSRRVSGSSDRGHERSHQRYNIMRSKTKWQTIASAPQDGRIVRVKRVFEGKVVREGDAVYDLPHPSAPMLKPLGPDPLGRPYDHERDLALCEQARSEKRWLRPDRMYAFPEPTHWLPDNLAVEQRA